MKSRESRCAHVMLTEHYTPYGRMRSGERSWNQIKLILKPAQKIMRATVRRYQTLTVRKRKNTDDQEERDDQDQSHPNITVRILFISETKDIFTNTSTAKDESLFCCFKHIRKWNRINKRLCVLDVKLFLQNTSLHLGHFLSCFKHHSLLLGIF